MEQKKNKSLLRQIQAKLSYLKNFETVSPSSFPDITTIFSNHNKTVQTYSKQNLKDVKILTSPLKKNVQSLKSCFSEAVVRLWWSYYKISYRNNIESAPYNYSSIELNSDENLLPCYSGRNHIVSLRELAAFMVADSITKQLNPAQNKELEDEYEESEEEANSIEKDLFTLIPSYIPPYLHNIILFEHIVNICIEKVNIPNILKSLIEICLKYRAYHQAYKLLKKHFILKPYKVLEKYKWAYSTAQKMYKNQEFFNFIKNNITIYHIYRPCFIHVIDYFQTINKKNTFYLVEKALEVLINHINDDTNKPVSQPPLITNYIPSCIDINQEHFQPSSFFSSINLNITTIDLNNKKELNYYYSLCRHLIKLYIEMSKETNNYIINNLPLSVLPNKMNSAVLNNFKCITSPLVIQHLLNYNKPHYKIQHPEIFFPSNSPKFKKFNIKHHSQWKKCYQYIQYLDYQFLEETFGFSKEQKKFQKLIQVMENVKFYEEAFAYVNWMYDTLNYKTLSPFKSDGRYSQRRRKIVNYNEHYSDEDSNDENFIFETPKSKSKKELKLKSPQIPKFTSPITPNKITNKYLPSLYQKAKSLANIINNNSTNSQWQYEPSIESWIKKKTIPNNKTNTYTNLNIDKNIHSELKSKTKSDTHKNRNNIIIIDDENENDNNFDNTSHTSSNDTIYVNKRKSDIYNTQTREKKIKLIYYQNEQSISTIKNDVKIQTALPFNDEIDDFLL